MFLAPWLAIFIWPCSIHSLVLTQCNWKSIPFPGTELGELSWLWLGLMFWCVFAASSSGLRPWYKSLQVFRSWVCCSLCRRGEKHFFFFQSKVYTYPISLCSGKFLHSILGKYQKFSVVGREEHELPALSHFLLFWDLRARMKVTRYTQMHLRDEKRMDVTISPLMVWLCLKRERVNQKGSWWA